MLNLIDVNNLIINENYDEAIKLIKGRLQQFKKAQNNSDDEFLWLTQEEHLWLLCLSIAYYKQKNYKKALKAISRAMSLVPSYRIEWHYARTLASLNKHTAAIKSYKKLLAEGVRKIAVDEGMEEAEEMITDCRMRLALEYMATDCLRKSRKWAKLCLRYCKNDEKKKFIENYLKKLEEDILAKEDKEEEKTPIFTPSALIRVERHSKYGKRGRTVVATADIKKGTLIESCPVIRIPDKEIYGEPPFLPTISHYCFVWTDYEGDEYAALVLGYGSLYNHSYNANAYYTQKNEDCMEFYACENIKCGEEVTINYNGPPKSKKEYEFSKTNIWQ